jgi:hypothetical protein
MKWTTVYRSDGRIEFVDEHGCGHPAAWCSNTIHGCNGSCSDPSFPGRPFKGGDILLTRTGISGVVITQTSNGRPVIFTEDTELILEQPACVVGTVSGWMRTEITEGEHSPFEEYIKQNTPAGWLIGDHK